MTSLADLAGCPEDALRWAALGWRAGCDESYGQGFTAGFRAAEDEMAARWAAAAAPVRRVLAMPDQAELQRRRDPGMAA